MRVARRSTSSSSTPCRRCPPTTDHVLPSAPPGHGRETQMVIQRVGPVSCAKIVGTLYAVLGLVFGAVFSVFAMVGGAASDNSGFGAMGALLGVGAIVLLPICYGALGFISTFIGAWLYNLLAGAVGGIE